MTDRNYSLVSEAPGVRVTAEATRMLGARYAVAAEWSQGRDVLEVGCGAGMGLGALAASARFVVGGDYAGDLLSAARQHYGSMPLVRLDGQRLPFRDASFDVVVLYEAIYYLDRANDFVAEARRVLRPGGALLVCSANPELDTFNPSPMSTRYWTGRELKGLLDACGFATTVHGAFEDGGGVATRLVRAVKRTAVALGVMPRTMRGKELLKRLFLGELTALPAELPAGASLPELTPLDGIATRHKVVYAIGRLPTAGTPEAVRS